MVEERRGNEAPRGPVKVARRTAMVRRGKGYVSISITVDRKMLDWREEHHPDMSTSEFVRDMWRREMERAEADDIATMMKRLGELTKEAERLRYISRDRSVPKERRDECRKELKRLHNEEIGPLAERLSKAKEAKRAKELEAGKEARAKAEAEEARRELEARRQRIKANIKKAEERMAGLYEELNQTWAKMREGGTNDELRKRADEIQEAIERLRERIIMMQERL